MIEQNRVKNIEFEYPIEIKEDENVIIYEQDGFLRSASVDPGWYFISSNSSKPSEFESSINYNLYEAITDDLNGDLKFEMSSDNIRPSFIGPTDTDIALIFSNAFFTLPPEYLGFPEDQDIDVSVSGSAPIELTPPYSPKGRWVIFSRYSDNNSVESKQWIQEHRVMNSTSVFASNIGNTPTYSSFNFTNNVDFIFRNIPSPMIWSYAGDRTDEWSKAFSSSISTSFDGNPNYAIEHLWEAMNHSYSSPEDLFKVNAGTDFVPYEQASHISVKIQYEESTPSGESVERYRGYVTDSRVIGSFWNLISDESDSFGEMYKVNLPMNLVPYDEPEA